MFNRFSYLAISLALSMIFHGFEAQSSSALNKKQGRVVINVSVDWEGDSLYAYNLRVMNDFRKEFPNIPLIHFLNAAYYTKKDALDLDITDKIQSVLREGDEHGLHIHGWKSLVEAAGLEYRGMPSFVNEPEIDCRWGDCGHTVALSAYSQSELSRVISHSKKILMDHGFTRPVSFRAGAWIANEDLISALIENGFKYDSSAVPFEHLSPFYSEYALGKILGSLWVQITPTSQPYWYESSNGGLMEMPNNGCLADYMSSSEMFEVFKENVDAWLKNSSNDIYVHFGFHQESAGTYLYELKKAIKLIQDYAVEHDIPVSFETFQSSERIAIQD